MSSDDDDNDRSVNSDYRNRRTGRNYIYPEKYGRALAIPFSEDGITTILDAVASDEYTAKEVTAAILLYGWAAVMKWKYVPYFRFAKLLNIELKQVPHFAKMGSLLGVHTKLNLTKKGQYRSIEFANINGAPCREHQVTRDITVYTMTPKGEAEGATDVMIAFIKAMCVLSLDPNIPKKYRQPFDKLTVNQCAALMKHIRMMYHVRNIIAKKSGRRMSIKAISMPNPEAGELNRLEQMLHDHIMARASYLHSKGVQDSTIIEWLMIVS